MRGVRQNSYPVISITLPADVCRSSVLQIVKLQSKIRMVIDSHHNTPREMMFESARVRKLHRQLDSFSCLPVSHRIALSPRNVTPSVTSSS